MSVRVEFSGVPRAQTETESTIIQTVAGEIRLGEVIAILAARYPKLAGTCLVGNRLLPGVVATVNAQQGLTEPTDTLRDGDVLLLRSLESSSP